MPLVYHRLLTLIILHDWKWLKVQPVGGVETAVCKELLQGNLRFFEKTRGMGEDYPKIDPQEELSQKLKKEECQMSEEWWTKWECKSEVSDCTGDDYKNEE